MFNFYNYSAKYKKVKILITVTGKENMRHICVRDKQVRSAAEIFSSITNKSKNIKQSYKHHCDTYSRTNGHCMNSGQLKRICYAVSYMRERGGGRES